MRLPDDLSVLLVKRRVKKKYDVVFKFPLFKVRKTASVRGKLKKSGAFLNGSFLSSGERIFFSLLSPMGARRTSVVRRTSKR